MYAFTARQYWEVTTSVPAGSNLWMALHFVIAAARHAPDMAVDLIETSLPPVVLYTDASDEDGNTRIGAKLLVPGQPPQSHGLGPVDSRQSGTGARRIPSSTKPNFTLLS